MAIDRQVAEWLQASLRDASSDKSGSSTLDSYLGRIESTFGALNDNDLSARMSSFFDSFKDLATNASDAGKRSVVIQNGVSLASYMQDMRQGLVSIRDDAESQIQQLGKQADSLVKQIASFNQQISKAETSGSTAGALRDQRDSLLNNLSQIMDVKVYDQGNGMVNVMVGNVGLVMGTTARGVATKTTTDATGEFASTNLVCGDNGDPLTISGGSAAALVTARDTHIANAIGTLDSMAKNLITTVNGIHSQGQGLEDFSSVTGTTAVKNTGVALNAALSTTGLVSMPVNGTFNLYINDTATGSSTTQQIKVNLTGMGAQTTLSDLAAALTSSNITATIDGAGHLNIKSNNPNTTFSFGEDSSGVLAALGINTFFSGSDAASIAMNTTLTQNPALLATSRGSDGTNGSNNKNALALALGFTAGSSQLGGQSLRDYYSNYIGTLANQAKTATDDKDAQSLTYDTINAQREAYSGVNMDEEAINLTRYQRAFQGTARFISVVNDMMDTVLGMVK